MPNTQVSNASRPEAASHQTAKYAYIDALRGYAVLLVITCHTGGMLRQLPYPLKKLTNFGWHGVQLFFLLSCLTLLLSWHSDRAKGRTNITHFWLRRLFRIAPMYFLAGMIYFLIEKPTNGFDASQLIATLTFVNAWHPLLIPTVKGRWMVVPGGWSIGVEMTFYVVFPLIASLVTSGYRAILFTGFALVIGSLATIAMADQLYGQYDSVAVDDFLYFWFPNQLPVFALGTLLFFLLRWTRNHSTAGLWLGKHSTPVILACATMCGLAANTPFTHHLPPSGALVLPVFIVASLIFIPAILALAHAPASPFVNTAARSLGKVSFSAYLLHFAVLHKLCLLLPMVFNDKAVGWKAISTCVTLGSATVLLTWGLSLLTFKFIEQPAIELGRDWLGSGKLLHPEPARL